MSRTPVSKCIFCGTGKLTKEHIWADWLKKYIPRTTIKHSLKKELIHAGGIEFNILEHNGDVHSRRIRCVCASCNNGWMSKIQNDVKPILIPMLSGEEVVLRKKERVSISSWVGMMIMVAEYLDPDSVSISQADRCFLLKNKKLPSHWHVWIGHANRQMQPRFSHAVFPLTKGKSGEVIRRRPGDLNTQTSTICVGEHLLIHTISSDIARSLMRRWRPPENIKGSLVKVWPVGRSAVKWPPQVRLGDSEIDLLANLFSKQAQGLIKDTLGQ
jgi:hypothetical protein